MRWCEKLDGSGLIHRIFCGSRPTVESRRFLVGTLVVVLVLAGLVVWLVALPIDRCPAHLALEFGGNSAEATRYLHEHCPSLTVGGFRTSLIWDLGFMIVYGLGLFALLSQSRHGWDVSVAGKLTRAVRPLPLLAAGFDVVENILIWVTIGPGPKVALESDALLLTILSIAWIKWLLVGIALVVALASIWTYLARRAKKRSGKLSPQHGAGKASEAIK